MKKVITSLVLAVAMLAFSVTTYAASETTGDMEVSYEYTASSGGDSGGGDSGGSGGNEGEPQYNYVVNIPAKVTVNDMEVVPITLVDSVLPNSKKLEVTVDWDKSYDADGYFNLFRNKGLSDEEAIRCRVYVYTDSTLSTLQALDSHQNPDKKNLVVDFMPGATEPTYGGYLCFSPLTENINVNSGTYTGVIYFNIGVVDR